MCLAATWKLTPLTSTTVFKPCRPFSNRLKFPIEICSSESDGYFGMIELRDRRNESENQFLEGGHGVIMEVVLTWIVPLDVLVVHT
jgi:hypothetical protein